MKNIIHDVKSYIDGRCVIPLIPTKFYRIYPISDKLLTSHASFYIVRSYYSMLFSLVLDWGSIIYPPFS